MRARQELKELRERGKRARSRAAAFAKELRKTGERAQTYQAYEAKEKDILSRESTGQNTRAKRTVKDRR